MDIKIRLRTGDLEVDYEGPQEFLTGELSNILQILTTAHRPLPPSSGDREQASNPPDNNSDGSSDHKRPPLRLTTATIVARMGNNEGSSLVLAAAAHLTLVEGRTPFSRAELHDDMKAATGYYSTSAHGSNLSAILRRLIKSRKLIEVATGKYELSAGERTRIEQLVA
jgi:hypothetical protein